MRREGFYHRRGENMLCLEVLGRGKQRGEMTGGEREDNRKEEKIKFKLSAVGKLGYCTRKQ